MSENKEDSKLLELMKSLDGRIESLNSKVESLHEKVDKVQNDIDNKDFSKNNTTNNKSKDARPRLGTIIQSLATSEFEQQNRDNCDVQFLSIREVGETVFSQNLFRKASGLGLTSKERPRDRALTLSKSDRTAQAILSKNVQETLELYDEGFDFNQIIENEASVGFKKSWIQFMLGWGKMCSYFKSSLFSSCHLIFIFLK